MIYFENFSKSYRDFVAVRDVSFTAQAGRVTVLLGANGAGKTTLLRAVPALHYATSGNVFVSDAPAPNENRTLSENVSCSENVTPSENRLPSDCAICNVNDNPALAKKLVGYVPENPILYEDMAVAEFLASSAELHGIAKAQLHDAVRHVMSQCSLNQVATQKIKTLSKGYRQRVSLAAAIVHNPPNIVLDEPASGLDPAQINHLRNLISGLAQTKSVLLSTHIISEAVAIDAYLVIIANQTVAIQGTAQEICAATKTSSLEEAYLHFAGDKI